MDNSEKISGNKIFGILDQLKNNHSILNIHVMDTDLDSMTIILDVSDGEEPHFIIDYPGRANSDAAISVGKKCYFEFSDEDKIPYGFKASITGIFGKKIKFNFPEFIERSQRRKAFRTTVPSGSRLVYTSKNDQFRFDIIDVSEGGLLVSMNAASHNKDILFEGNKLEKLSLSSKQEDFSVKINIKSAEIVRLEEKNESRRIKYGLKIIDIDSQDRDDLRRFVYYCQRKALKKRGELYA